MTTAEKIIKLCAINNTTPARVMNDVGLTRAAFSAWKNGKQKASDSSIARLAERFGVVPDQLRDDDSDEVIFTSSLNDAGETQKERILLSIFRTATKEQQTQIIAEALRICDN